MAVKTKSDVRRVLKLAMKYDGAGILDKFCLDKWHMEADYKFLKEAYQVLEKEPLNVDVIRGLCNKHQLGEDGFNLDQELVHRIEEELAPFAKGQVIPIPAALKEAVANIQEMISGNILQQISNQVNLSENKEIIGYLEKIDHAIGVKPEGDKTKPTIKNNDPVAIEFLEKKGATANYMFCVDCNTVLQKNSISPLDVSPLFSKHLYKSNPPSSLYTELGENVINDIKKKYQFIAGHPDESDADMRVALENAVILSVDAVLDKEYNNSVKELETIGTSQKQSSSSVTYPSNTFKEIARADRQEIKAKEMQASEDVKKTPEEEAQEDALMSDFLNRRSK